MTMPYGAPDAGDEAYRHWLRSQSEADAAMDSLLASDADRDQVCRRLASAFSEGRITSAELDERTSQALTARTHGDLDAVMRGLTVPTVPAPPGPLAPLGYAPPAARAPGSVNPRMVFWIVCFFMAPSLLTGLTTQGAGGLLPVLVIGPILYLVYRRLYPRT
jgi:hypothetical protein